MYKPQSNLEEKVNPSILKYFFSRTDPAIFTSMTPVLLDQTYFYNADACCLFIIIMALDLTHEISTCSFLYIPGNSMSLTPLFPLMF